MDIEKVAKAIEADAGQPLEGLRESLAEMIALNKNMENLKKEMKIVHEGDKGRGICGTCKELKETTYRVQDVELSDGYGTAKNVLVAVCDTCDALVAMPQQSAPLIRARMDEVDRLRGKQSES